MWPHSDTADYLPQPNSTQPRVGLALFSYAKPTHKTKPQNQTTPHHKTDRTFSQLLHNQTRPNSVCNLLSTHLEDSCNSGNLVLGFLWIATKVHDKIISYAQSIIRIVKNIFFFHLETQIGTNSGIKFPVGSNDILRHGIMLKSASNACVNLLYSVYIFKCSHILH